MACPFLHKGSWARIPEQVAVALTFKPPRNDINAPDLYIPLMGFWSYVLAASTLQVRRGEFSPEGVAVHASWGLALWTAEAVFVWMALRSLSSSHNHVSAPMMDLAAYTGYMFVLVAAALATKILFLPYWGQSAPSPGENLTPIRDEDPLPPVLGSDSRRGMGRSGVRGVHGEDDQADHLQRGEVARVRREQA